jgi:hypothetical protein
MTKAYKLNTLALARHHRKHCEGEECDVSLTILMMMAEQCGAKFTEKEKELFI